MTTRIETAIAARVCSGALSGRAPGSAYAAVEQHQIVSLTGLPSALKRFGMARTDANVWPLSPQDWSSG